MAYCEKKGLYCSEVGKCEQNTNSCDLPDWVEKEIVFSAEDLERLYGETIEEKAIKSFDQLLTELSESGIKLIKDYHAASKSCEDAQKKVYSLKAELTATRDLLEAFEQGSVVSSVVIEKIINYLTDLSTKPISRKTAINKAVKWIKNNFDK